MATISTAIENTLRRIGTVAGVSGQNVRAVWRGISKEFGRFVDYRFGKTRIGALKTLHRVS